MEHNIIFLLLLFIIASISNSSQDTGLLYDHSAYTECKLQPEKPLYGGGILKDSAPPGVERVWVYGSTKTDTFGTPGFVLQNLTQPAIYSFSIWVKIQGNDSAHIRVRLNRDGSASNCIGSVLAKPRCWSFLKGGFTLSSPSNLTFLYFQNVEDKDIRIAIDSVSLQPFTEEEWRSDQQYNINKERKRATTIHISSKLGVRLEGAKIEIQQISKDFPIGSAISQTVIGDLAYQNWFSKRFNAAVFENELKWYATEPEQGQINYTLADKMLEFVRANQIMVRGHNIFWEDPKYTPSWVKNLTGPDLQLAVKSRIQSLMSKYKEEFIHWDVSNEMLHFDFYEQRLGPNATLHFYEMAHEFDPLATLFLNEFNVVETCSDVNTTVDPYVEKIKELRRGGVSMDGIGLEGHFTVPNLALIRGILDKLATLELPIWLTELDISSKLDKQTQGIYLEQVLREGFSHPAVNGMIMWSALDKNGCYQMCLTDSNFNNLPAGDVVDKLLKEWETGVLEGQSDKYGSFSFFGFLGEYRVTVEYENRTVSSMFSLDRSDETKHFNIQL